MSLHGTEEIAYQAISALQWTDYLLVNDNDFEEI
jgi:hypothetical protein